MQTMHFPQGCHRKAKHPGMTGVFLIITLPLRGYFLRGTFGTALEGLRGAVFSATAALGSSLFAEASGSGLPDLEGPLPPDGLRVVFAVAAFVLAFALAGARFLAGAFSLFGVTGISAEIASCHCPLPNSLA
jgi:hypothetical protein